MKRHETDFLDAWLKEPGRLPLLVRGARQVGKTWLVRDLAQRHGLDLVECNLEREPAIARCFRVGSSPRRILDDLSLVLGREVGSDRSLLFIDEIQTRGEVLATLRWFAEDMPRLPLVAAGSLLEFVLGDATFSMPVGRISILHVGPMTFPEFLAAHGEDRLVDRLRAWEPSGGAANVGEVVHDHATTWWTRFVMTGGMPAVVGADPAKADPRAVRRLQSDLVATYRDDFSKYAARIDPHVVDAVLRSIALQLGGRFVCSHVGEGVRHAVARRALELLAKARLCHLVTHSAANGLPLGGEANDRLRKVILLDVGLLHPLLATPAGAPESLWARMAPRVRGQIAEQAAGQELLALREPWEEPSLHHWQRGGGRPGEVDYLLPLEGRVVPVETKSGAAGGMKSLHQFMHDKRLDLAVRCDANPPSLLDVDVKTTTGDPARYRLLSVPPYLLWRLPQAVARLVDRTVGRPPADPGLRGSADGAPSADVR